MRAGTGRWGIKALPLCCRCRCMSECLQRETDPMRRRRADVTETRWRMTASTGTALRLAAVALDCPNPRSLAGFYAKLLGWQVDESQSNDQWVELADPAG